MFADGGCAETRTRGRIRRIIIGFFILPPRSLTREANNFITNKKE
jgi:hypothetical protein